MILIPVHVVQPVGDKEIGDTDRPGAELLADPQVRRHALRQWHSLPIEGVDFNTLRCGTGTTPVIVTPGDQLAHQLVWS